MFDYAERRRRLSERMRAEGVDALFLAPSSDLEYLTGIERGLPTFGQTSQAHDWVSGGFFRPDAEPVFLFSRMAAVFELASEPPGELVVVNETDDGRAAFERVARGLGAGTVAVGDRVWARTVLELSRVLDGTTLRTGSSLVNELRRVKSPEELETMTRACGVVADTMAAVAPLVVPGATTAELVEQVEHEMRRLGSRTPSFATRVFTGFWEGDLDSEGASAREPLREGMSLLFDFGAVVNGYCSDFGRTIYCGEPPAEYREHYEIMLAAQEAGRVAAEPGALACEVNAACRRPIEEAGLGEHFRHRMGHGIGLNIHEWPFISSEDETPLEAGMTFTDEPSIIIPGRWSLRIEDIVECAEGGGRMLNSYPAALVANS